jgi:hypothetical protein
MGFIDRACGYYFMQTSHTRTGIVDDNVSNFAASATTHTYQ